MTQIQVLETIKGLGKIVRCYAPFDEQIRALKRKAGAKPPYLMHTRDIAFMRLNGGSTDETRTCLAPIHAKNSPIILAMTSSLIRNLKMAEQAVQAHKDGEYFFTETTEIYDKYAEQAEKDKNRNPKNRRAIILPEKEKFLIQPNTELAQILLGESQEQYFDRFAQNGINFFPISSEVVDNQKGTLINHVWFRGTDFDSDLSGDNWFLYNDSGAFGVLKSSK